MKRDPRLVFVTGAGSGIGRATAVRFAANGAAVVVTDINLATARETARLINEAGGTSYAHKLDVSDAGAFERLAEKVRTKYGVPDVVVNNAGFALGTPFLEHSTEDWEHVLGVHLMGVVHGSRLFGKQMADRGEGGHIVNLSSIAGFIPTSLAASYCTAKAAIRHLSVCLHAELAQYDIGVTAICPGLIGTNIHRAAELRGVDADGYEVALSGLDFAMAHLSSPPDKVARAIVRAVQHNTAIVPVRPEAWIGMGMSRVSPSFTRGLSRVLSREGSLDAALRAADRLRPRRSGGSGRVA